MALRRSHNSFLKRGGFTIGECLLLMAIVCSFVIVLCCCLTEASLITKGGTIILLRVKVGVNEDVKETVIRWVSQRCQGNRLFIRFREGS